MIFTHNFEKSRLVQESFLQNDWPVSEHSLTSSIPDLGTGPGELPPHPWVVVQSGDLDAVRRVQGAGDPATSSEHSKENYELGTVLQLVLASLPCTANKIQAGMPSAL